MKKITSIDGHIYVVNDDAKIVGFDGKLRNDGIMSHSSRGDVSGAFCDAEFECLLLINALEALRLRKLRDTPTEDEEDALFSLLGKAARDVNKGIDAIREKIFGPQPAANGGAL